MSAADTQSKLSAKERKREKDRRYRVEHSERLKAEHRERYKREQLLPQITQTRLKELVVYNHETGLFLYAQGRGSRDASNVAGHTAPDGRAHIVLD